ncbi:MAG: glycosyltransferase family 4 protein [Mesorhizobium sp.]
MRIAHICLAAFYIDGFGYQENILPKIHRKMGHEVLIIASTETYVDKAKLGYVAPSSYENEDGIPVHRLPYARWAPRRLRPKIRAYEGLAAHLESFRPDLIFLHDVQFWDILTVRNYALSRGIPVHADSHTDHINSARGFVSRRLLHGIFYRLLLKRADPAIRRYLPTLPVRGDFMREVYGTPADKIDLLPFGFDDTAVAGIDRAAVREKVRAGLGIPAGDIVLVTGGKLDLRKNIHVLAERFTQLRRNGALPGVHLLVFGKPVPEVEAIVRHMTLDSHVHMTGWIPSANIYGMFWAADLAIFPGTHSVLWEEAIGHGLGTVFYRWPGMEHLDLGGNARFIDDASPATLDALLVDLAANDGAAIRAMGTRAAQEGPKIFSYSAIAEKAITAPIR